MKELDALECLRSQGFPDESVTTQRYDILQWVSDFVKITIIVEDTISAVGETGSFYVSVGNLTNIVQKLKRGTMLATAAPVRFHAVPQCACDHREECDG